MIKIVEGMSDDYARQWHELEIWHDFSYFWYFHYLEYRLFRGLFHLSLNLFCRCFAAQIYLMMAPLSSDTACHSPPDFFFEQLFRVLASP